MVLFFCKQFNYLKILMPELPEVETTKEGLKPLILNKKISDVIIRQPKLRWIIPSKIKKILPQQEIVNIIRRGKYLIIQTNKGDLIIHLGMSGSLRIIDKNSEVLKHDHFDLVLNNNSCVRLRDPRRFGAVLFSENYKEHKLIKNLGIEPLDKEFNGEYLYKLTQNKKRNIKSFIMDSHIIVGIGNIYACESLFLTNLSPFAAANNINKNKMNELVINIKIILKKAIAAGGTTLKDFSKVDGSPGYFANTLNVYARENNKCPKCSSIIKKVKQNTRSTFYCPQCQK